jgi:hypothetical protein
MADEVDVPDESDMDILNTEDSPEEKPNKENEDINVEPDPDAVEEPDEDEDEDEREDIDEERRQEKEEEDKDKDRDLEALDARGKDLVGKIKKVSPDLLRKVPELRGVIFRDHEFGKIFPSIEDAKEASSRLRTMDLFEQSIMSGDSTLVLSALSQSDPSAYKKFASNFLPTLFKGDRQTYVQVTLPLVKNLIRSAINDGDKLGGDFGKNLRNAGKIIAKHLFDSYDVPEDPKPTRNSEQDRFEQERRNFYAARYQEFDTGTKLTALNKFESELDTSLSQYNLPKFIKESLIHAIIRETNDSLGKDGNHVALMNSLWARAKKSGLSEAAKSQIISAYLGRAKTVMPAIRARLLKEALANRGISTSKDKSNRVFPTKTNNAPRVTRATGVSSRNIDYRKTSDMDILNDRVTTKGR